MEAEEVYRAWAPAGALWSDWVAPALFVQTGCPDRAVDRAPEDLSWFPSGLPERIAIVLDLPGAKSVRLGAELAVTRGFRPVPVINASPGPRPTMSMLSLDAAPVHVPASWGPCVVDMSELVRALCAVTPTVQALTLRADAPPVFLLDDARTHGSQPPEEGTFDNRWMVFPQDFPSAAFLQSHGIGDVLLVQEAPGRPREDLAHVLLRWQEAGLQIHGKDGAILTIQRPSRFRALWYRAVASLGLKRNRAGGFGEYIQVKVSQG